MDTEEINALADAVAQRLEQRQADDRTGLPATRHGMKKRDEERICALFAPPSPLPTQSEVARFIDHTQLKPDADRGAIEELCEQAREHNFFSVCVNSANVRLAHTLLHGSRTKVCAVVGFPLGAALPSSKAFEAREAMRQGAAEIDMVLNIGALKSRDYGLVSEGIRAVVEAVPGKIVKVILECAALTEREKILASALAKGAGAHFVKTATGFGGGGATVEDVRLMREVVGEDMGVKASGGVRDLATAQAMFEAGANRLGCSSSVAIVTGGSGNDDY